MIVSRAMPVRSDVYGITGKCDIVEFHLSDDGVSIYGRDGKWLPVPIEYKRGKSKEIDADRLQLCAQAMCLEEMFCCSPIQKAYLYYAEVRRREPVLLDTELRNNVIQMLREMRKLYDLGHTPKVKVSSKCRSCSLCNVCLPKLQKYSSATAYTKNIWEDREL